jgi:multiple sugar transport system permease protein
MRQKQFTLRWAVVKILNVFVLLFFTLPLVAIVLGAIQTEKSLVQDHMSLIPTEFSIVAFEIILLGRRDVMLGEGGFYQLPRVVYEYRNAFMNSLIIAVSTTVLNLVFGSMAAYAIARLPFRWTKAFMYANLGSRMVPLIILLVPLFVTLRGLGLLNSRVGVILTLTGFLMPYTIWILHSFFAGFPRELEDAARIDGCTRFGAFRRVVLPLSAPAMAAAGAIVFILSWNEFLIPFIVVSRPEIMPIPVVLASLVGDFHVYYSVLSAAILIGLLPSALLAVLLQRYIVRGLTSGALKG